MIAVDAPNTKARFLAKVAQQGDCHEWQSVLHRDGYGKFYLEGKQEFAHRAAYRLFIGEIERGLNVLHKCDNRKCVNPEHLYLGDTRDNARDRTERARWTHNRQPSAVVEEIRSRYLAGGVTQQDLAREYGYHQTQISKIVRRVQRVIK